MLRAMHGLAGDAAGWGDEAVLAGVGVIVAAFLAYGGWQRRRAGGAR